MIDRIFFQRNKSSADPAMSFRAVIDQISLSLCEAAAEICLVGHGSRGCPGTSCAVVISGSMSVGRAVSSAASAIVLLPVL